MDCVNIVYSALHIALPACERIELFVEYYLYVHTSPSTRTTL